MLMKKTALMLLAIMTIASIFQQSQAQDKRDDVASKVRQYAVYPLKYDMESLSEQDRELVTIFIQIANIMDELYWEQCFGLENKAKLESLADLNMYEYAKINYGAWDRMDGNKPFLPNYKNKPEGANFYPANMTKKEFENLKNPLKTSPYTILRRDIKGNLIVIPYSQAYSRQLMEVDMLLDKAISIAENPSLREYLMAKREALQTDDYLNSDIAWMDMKDSHLDFVFGPIENYEDGLYGYKTAYEAFVLIKDKEWSERLKHYTELLPEMQRMLPCKPEYKKERPGTNSDINVYDVIYYAGDCNAAGKTIAINLPNDEKVQLSHGTRRLQLRNAMQAKFDMIVKPIADLAISKNQQGNIKFNAFFNNVCFHEVAHGLGIKQTITGKGTVREALQNQYSAWEEAKAVYDDIRIIVYGHTVLSIAFILESLVKVARKIKLFGSLKYPSGRHIDVDRIKIRFKRISRIIIIGLLICGRIKSNAQYILIHICDICPVLGIYRIRVRCVKK